MTDPKDLMMDKANNEHWLSDFMIADMRAAFAKRGIWGHRADAFCAAIRALRDAAQKVCASPRVHPNGAQGAVDNSYYHVHPTAMILLAALLPDSEVKP